MSAFECCASCSDLVREGIRQKNRAIAAEAERDRLTGEVETLRARLAAVEALHTERDWRPLDGTYLGGTVCGHCRRPWPCSTITALGGGSRA